MQGASPEIIKRCQRDPLFFFREVLGVSPWERQADIIHSVRDNRRTAVKSCHGAGKSWIAGRIALWWLVNFPYSKVLTTAPTFRQVKKILWQEIRAAHTRAKYPLCPKPLQHELNIDDGWFALGFSTDDPDAAQGQHAEHLLAILDEASGIPAPIWEALEGNLSSEHNHLLSIGNPTDPASMFADECKTPGVSVIPISAFDTPNFTSKRGVVIPGLITPVWVEEKKRKWGESSPMYRSRVLGEFPEASKDSLIPIGHIEAARNRTLEPAKPHRLALDVARYGDDESIIVHRRGPVVRVVFSSSKKSTMETSGKVVRCLDDTGAPSVVVDGTGVGGGVVDRLSELSPKYNWQVIEFNAGEKAKDSERFGNVRAEAFWHLRGLFERGEIDIDEGDQDLAAQLAAIKFKIDSKGRILIESKEDMKKKGRPSPDRADALAMAFYEKNAAEDFVFI